MIPTIDISIGGETRPVRYSNAAIAMFCKELGVTARELSGLNEETMQPHHVLGLVWAGLWDGARKAGRPFTADIWDVSDWLEEAGADVAERLVALFVEAHSAGGAGDEGNAVKPPSP